MCFDGDERPDWDEDPGEDGWYEDWEESEASNYTSYDEYVYERQVEEYGPTAEDMDSGDRDDD